MKKTKIICTIGPGSDSRETLKQLILHGMDTARFNFSHGSHEEHKKRYQLLRELAEETGIPVAALLDTKGPEIRTGLLQDGQKVTLQEGQEFVLTTEEMVGNAGKVWINYDGLNEDVKEDDRILIDDGLIELRVKRVDGPQIICHVMNGGELGERKGVNVPGVRIKLPALTDKDKEDIRFGMEMGFDYIAASFVRSADAIREIRSILKAGGSDMGIIAKVENAEGLDNLEEIMEVSDGIMVARGDLGVEIELEKLPYLQKTMIEQCSQGGKIVITATQMLDSMIRNPRPTRAEVTDVANAVYDGTDVVMLSGETANGKYPVEALKMMVHIIEETESHLDENFYKQRQVKKQDRYSVSNAVCYSSVSTAKALGAKIILAPTISGYTGRMLSKWRPSTRLICVSPNLSAVRRMQLYWGVTPFQYGRPETTDDMIRESIDFLKEKGIVEEGDLTIVTAGVMSHSRKTEPARDTNSMRVVMVD